MFKTGGQGGGEQRAKVLVSRSLASTSNPQGMDQTVLTTTDHSRERAGLRYVYPVLSRRSRGLSVGVNLNPNNACNWRCVYCQVEGLRKGAAPSIDIVQLGEELEAFLGQVLRGDYLERHLPVGFQELRDIAISGNGEPTTAREFPEVIQAIARVRGSLGIGASVKTILITNGSQLHRPEVRQGIERLASLTGEVWFKVDRVTREGLWQVNRTRMSPERVERNLAMCAELCPTWIQTCMFSWDGAPPPEAEIEAYLEFLQRLWRQTVPLCGVLLYTVARPSAQPEARHLAPLTAEALCALADRICEVGLRVQVYP
ncbi:hypothetical protein HRbin30_00119 [bacterium HR30]|nr:hypothetical protein HRbin30_00119 [bacterium HR30]